MVGWHLAFLWEHPIYDNTWLSLAPIYQSGIEKSADLSAGVIVRNDTRYSWKISERFRSVETTLLLCGKFTSS